MKHVYQEFRLSHWVDGGAIYLKPRRSRFEDEGAQKQVIQFWVCWVGMRFREPWPLVHVLNSVVKARLELCIWVANIACSSHRIK